MEYASSCHSLGYATNASLRFCEVVFCQIFVLLVPVKKSTAEIKTEYVKGAVLLDLILSD